MKKFGLNVLVINSDTDLEARSRGANLWKDARVGITMLFLSPEELASPGFTRLLEVAEFSDRVTVLGIDEIHLLYWWGRSF